MKTQIVSSSWLWIHLPLIIPDAHFYPEGGSTQCLWLLGLYILCKTCLKCKKKIASLSITKTPAGTNIKATLVKIQIVARINCKTMRHVGQITYFIMIVKTIQMHLHESNADRVSKHTACWKMYWPIRALYSLACQ